MAITESFDDISADLARRRSLRYLNLFRLTMAAIFLFFGKSIGLGEEAPGLFLAFAAFYLFGVLALGFPDAVQRLGFNRVVTLQMLLDIASLTLMMAVSGGTRGGLPMLLTVLLAGGGLVGYGRWVLFYAASATVAVLAENSVRFLEGGEANDFFVVGMVCIGFFGVALTARLLATRALTNEILARARAWIWPVSRRSTSALSRTCTTGRSCSTPSCASVRPTRRPPPCSAGPCRSAK